MNTKDAKVAIERAGYNFVKVDGEWLCKDSADGQVVSRGRELGALVQHVASLLGL